MLESFIFKNVGAMHSIFLDKWANNHESRLANNPYRISPVARLERVTTESVAKCLTLQVDIIFHIRQI